MSRSTERKVQMLRSRGTATRLAGAVMLGVGAIFGGKTRPDEHWSSTPTIEIEAEDAQSPSGDPPRR